MSNGSLRYLVGTARLRAAETARALRARARRRPRTATIVPRPGGQRRGGPRLRLSHALVACDLSPSYLDAWPLVRLAWNEIVGLEAVLVIVAEPGEVPAGMADAHDVQLFEPLPGVHTALQAQCIRLLYPALLDADGVVISDVDMAPLSGRYFRRAASRVPAGHFVAYRDVLLPLGEVPICYNAARPRTWGDVFGVGSADDVRARLAEWTNGLAYEGARDSRGWTKDQRLLHDTLLARGRSHRDVWILDDAWTRFRRLERTYVEKWGAVSPAAREGIAHGRYADFHCLLPYADNHRLNEEVVELAVAAARRR